MARHLNDFARALRKLAKGCLLVGAVTAAGPAAAGVAGPTLASATCAALVARVDQVPGAGPVFLRSYDDDSGQGAMAEPALANAAFTYDNALAIIALIACDRTRHALRLGEALLSAATLDRAADRGRLRNAYRAGAQEQRPIPPMGWWDGASNRWLEDPYQVGTATGNVAWGALALLTLHQATGDVRFRDGAARLAGWVVARAHDPRGPGGFNGGIQGYDDAPQPLTWKSTEHNTDLAAAFGWLARSGAAGDWSAPERAARSFVQAMWSNETGHFATGTTPDGVTVNHATSGLDAQLWPLLLPDAPHEWRRALAYVERAHGVDGGFDFNDDRDGVWLEGTAQAALSFHAVGRTREAERALAEVAREISPGGYVWATRQPSITTGLAIGPDSTFDDFRYYRRPHLAATAWAALAALHWNPFVGRRSGDDRK